MYVYVYIHAYMYGAQPKVGLSPVHICIWVLY